eukprot:scaffold11488_cov109-Isochrysis_galbana.AAC.5
MHGKQCTAGVGGGGDLPNRFRRARLWRRGRAARAAHSSDLLFEGVQHTCTNYTCTLRTVVAPLTKKMHLSSLLLSTVYCSTL